MVWSVPKLLEGEGNMQVNSSNGKCEQFLMSTVCIGIYFGIFMSGINLIINLRWK